MKKTAILMVVLVALTSAVILTHSDESSADICDGVNVYIQNEDGSYTKSVVDNVQSVKEAIDKAIADQDRTMELNLTKTTITKIDGRSAPSGQYWRVFQWLAPGSSGWSLQGFNTNSNQNMASNCTYCVSLAEIKDTSGTVTYTVPDFEPKSTGYFFIRFANGFSPENEHVKKVFTSEIREQGFWIKGEGSTMGEVLKDAINNNWPGEIETYTGDAGGDDVSDWINILFGLGNDNLGNNTWAYWSQWCWNDHKWTYNDWTLGYYDPAVYPYMECIYLISTPDPYSGEYIIDKGGDEPNPDTDTITCMKNILTVQFLLPDGTVHATQNVEYGKQIDMSKINDPEVSGKGFVEWGNTTTPITSDTTFTASFMDDITGKVRIKYTTEDGQLIRYEYVSPGSAAAYSDIPVKLSTQQYDYVFKSWSDPLTSVTENITVTPVFNAQLRSYPVNFYNYDRSLITSVPTYYGTAATLPSEPTREPTVKYQYTFAGWSLTPNNYVKVDLDNITGVTYVYAYFEPSGRDYTLTFWDNGNAIAKYTAKYGSTLGETYPLELFKGTALAKLYRDSDLTRECDTNYIIVGDTNIYVTEIPGNYSAVVDSSGYISGNTITVAFDETLAKKLTVTDGKVVICDISQYPNGMTASISKDSLQAISSALGDSVIAEIKVPRGSISMPLSAMASLLDDGEDLTFSIENGPLNVKITTALKKINYSTFYRVDLRVANATVRDLEPLNTQATVTLLLELDEGQNSSVWNISSKGAITTYDSTYNGEYTTFTTDLLEFYAVGTTDAAVAKKTVVCPYGDIECDVDGSGITGSAKITSMTLDNMGKTLFIPSSVDGVTVTGLESGALNGVVNASTVVIPVTVDYFSWNNWTNGSIKDVYFLGDSPSFMGTVPSTVTVHHSPDASGWTVGDDDLVIRTYQGSYGKDAFSFTYYIVDETAVIHRYLDGTYVQIPAEISVDGTSYPVSYIGDGAFMFSKDSGIIDLYDLQYSTYRLETLDLDSNIRGILTRALMYSTIVNLYRADSVEYIWDEAFSDCNSLSYVTFDSELVFIGHRAFNACNGDAFTRFTVPDSVRLIKDHAFYQCSNLSTVTLGNGITDIPAYCFGHCVRLTDVELPESVTSISDYAFYNCSGLKYIDLNNVKTVGTKAFYISGTSSLEFIVFGENLESLGTEAFGNNNSLTELEVHCKLFSSFAEAFPQKVLDTIEVYASDEVISSWSAYNVQPLVEPEPQKDYTLLESIVIGMIIISVVLWIAIFYVKSHKAVRK